MIAAFEDQLRHLVGSLEEQRFLVACSGGMDSVVLAQLCWKLGIDFDLCHVNYHLRKQESEGDADFVSDLANTLNVRLYLLDCDLSNSNQNIQLAARQARYAWFDRLIAEKGYDLVMTAHHLNDSVETILFNLGRGTGVAGLTGIPDVNGAVIRPLLSFPQETIRQYAEDNKIAFRTDRSNLSDKYARNYLRHHVLPKLLAQNPNFLTGASMTMEHLKSTAHYSQLALDTILKTSIITESNNRLRLAVSIILDEDYPVALAYHWLRPYGFSNKQVEDFFDKKVWNNGASLLAEDWKLLYDRDFFILCPQKGYELTKISFNPRLIREVEFNGLLFSFEFIENAGIPLVQNEGIAYFDGAKVGLLTLRYRQDGDIFYPYGMSGKAKKLKKFFVDEKLDQDQKDSIPLLLHSDTIIWVVGRRTDHHYQVHKSSTELLQVTVSSV